MKKAGILFLSLVLLCLLPLAIAEEDEDAEVNFEGGWMSLGGSGYQIYLPINWASASLKGSDVFSAASADNSMRMSVVCKENQNTIESIMAMLAAKEGHTAVQVVSYNGRTFVTYKAANENFLGAVTLLGDGARAIWFAFRPLGNSGLASLSVKILNSFAPNQ